MEANSSKGNKINHGGDETMPLADATRTVTLAVADIRALLRVADLFRGALPEAPREEVAAPPAAKARAAHVERRKRMERDAATLRGAVAKAGKPLLITAAEAAKITRVSSGEIGQVMAQARRLRHEGGFGGLCAEKLAAEKRGDSGERTVWKLYLAAPSSTPAAASDEFDAYLARVHAEVAAKPGRSIEWCVAELTAAVRGCPGNGRRNISQVLSGMGHAGTSRCGLRVVLLDSTRLVDRSELVVYRLSAE